MKAFFKSAGLALLMQFSAVQLSHADEALLYRITAANVLPGSGHSWGFGALETKRPYLFIARRENGLTVFDVQKQKAIKTLDNSSGANAVAFVPKHDRAYVANMDGSVSVVALKELRVIKRVPVDSGNLNNAVYDQGNDRVIFTSGRRGDHSTLYFMDPRTNTITGSRDVPALKLDGPIMLGNGSLIVPMRDENKVAVLSGPQLENLQQWQYPECSKPSALAADEAGGRLFIACRGDTPTLIVADLASGVQQASLPITHAVNSMAYDTLRKQLLIPSGADANLSVIERDEVGQYRISAAIGSRPWAHNMVFDAMRGQAYLFAMEFTQPATRKGDPLFHRDTFTVLTFKADAP